MRKKAIPVCSGCWLKYASMTARLAWKYSIEKYCFRSKTKNAAMSATMTMRTMTLPLFMGVPLAWRAVVGRGLQEFQAQVDAGAPPDVAVVRIHPRLAGLAAAAVQGLQVSPIERGLARNREIREHL